MTRAGIAVVIPCFNLGATVEATVASVLAQTRPAAEIVLVDDGSDDPATIKALERLEKGPLKVLRGPNTGVAGARDRGVRATSSELLLLLDADDLIAPTFLEKTAALLDEDPRLDFVATSYELFGDASVKVVPPPPDQPVRHLASGSYCISALMRRRLWDEVGGCDGSLVVAEDWDFWLTVLERGARGALLDQPLFRYRIGAQSRDPRGLAARERYRTALEAIATKHRGLIERQGPALAEAQARHLAFMGDQEARLVEERRRTIGELASRGRSRPAPGVAILCYHRVAALAPDTFGLCVPPELFRAHLAHLTSRCTPMSLEEALRAVAARDLPERPVVLTFDDGYRDALEASRILAELGLPATFYANAERLDEPHETWEAVLERVFVSEDPIPPALEISLGDSTLALPCLGADSRRAAFAALHALGRAASERGRRDLVERVSRWSGLAVSPREGWRVATTGELRELAGRPGCEIGAHTAHHLLLPAHPGSLQRFEIVEGKRRLEEALGRPVRSFAYPYGEAQPRTVELARQAGFQSAVTTRPGLVRPWDDPLALPRMEVGAWSVAELAGRLEALFLSDD